MKYTFPLAYSMTLISWSLIEYELSFNHYGANLKEIIREGIRWLVEANSDSNKIYAVVGNHTFEEHFWGRAEDVKGVRQKYYISESKPGSDLAGEVAAAFAAASIVFSDEPDYKEMLISKVGSLPELFGF
jgi:endoglucanase